MKELYTSRQYRKDFKIALKRGKEIQKLQIILELLMEGEDLPARCRPHKLSGDYSGYWECHLEPDWLLIYEIEDTFISLIRTGTHSDLFE